MRHVQLATMLFGTPLLIERSKLQVILAAMGPRFGAKIETDLEDRDPLSGPMVYGPGDQGGSRKPYYVTEDGIGVISIFGPLVKRALAMDYPSGGPTTYGEIESEFQDAMSDPAIKGVLLLVDSPGGESVGTFELSDLIYSARGTKPIIAAADGNAFSAAYAIASAADTVYVTKTGGVGSVGVWMLHADYSGALEDAKIKVTFISYGARKIDGNPYQPLSDDAFAAFKTEVDRIGEMFVDTVARNRGMKAETVRGTQAALYFGENGTAIGFADEVGTVSDAMDEMRRRIAKSTGSSSVSVAASATISATKEGPMENPEVPTAEAEVPATAAENPTEQPKEPETPTPAAAAPPALNTPFSHAVAIVETCALANLSARATLKFLKPETNPESLRKELLTAQAAESGPEIHSHALPTQPETAAAGKPEDSPLVKACASIAQTDKEKN